jgi:hypothetical protein
MPHLKLTHPFAADVSERVKGGVYDQSIVCGTPCLL